MDKKTVPLIVRMAIPLARLIFTVNVHEQCNLPTQGGYLVVPNHRSLLDVVFLTMAFNGRVAFAATYKLFNIPLLGWLMRRMGCVPVYRRTTTGERRNNDALAEGAAQHIKDGGVFVIFGEGGIIKNGVDKHNRPVRISGGLYKIAEITGCPIVPTAMIGARRALRSGVVTIIFGEPQHQPVDAAVVSADLLKLFAATDAGYKA